MIVGWTRLSSEMKCMTAWVTEIKVSTVRRKKKTKLNNGLKPSARVIVNAFLESAAPGVGRRNH